MAKTSYSTKGYNLLTKGELEILEEKLKEHDELDIYTDGSAWTGSGCGGAAIVFLDKNDQEIDHIKLGFVKTSNNRMEFYALILSCQIINHFNHKLINIYSDSEYSIKTITGRFNGKANPDLIKLSDEINWNVTKDRIKKVKGHSGNKGNDLADRYCSNARISLEEEVRKNKKTVSERELNNTLAEYENTIIEMAEDIINLKGQIQIMKTTPNQLNAAEKLNLLKNELNSDRHMSPTELYKIRKILDKLEIPYQL